MSIVQSQYFKGNARKPVPHPDRKNQAMVYMFTHVFNDAVATTDILDLFPLIPYGRITGFEWATENIGAVNVSIGLMTGTPGSLDTARTCGTELASAVSAATGGNVGVTALAALAENGEVPVSIGFKTATDIAAGATKKLHIKITVQS